MDSLEGWQRRPDLKRRHKKKKNVDKDSESSDDDVSSSNRLLSAEEIIKLPKFDKKIKITSFDVPFNSLWTLHDVSLSVKGASEDRVFVKSTTYRKNIRRGTAVCQMYSPEFKTSIQDTFVIRKGLEKFFDLYIEFIEDESVDKEVYNFVRKNKMYNKIRDIILKRALNILDNFRKISLYKMDKINGENAQITYSKKLGCWVIASKNVTLVAKSKDQVHKYTNNRYEYAKLIAYKWFEILENKLPDEILSLKEDLSNKNMIGEYHGNKNFQHLIKYEKCNIMFYALVDLEDGDHSCLPPSTAFQFFEKHKLSYVGCKVVPHISGFNNFYQELKKIYEIVNTSSMEQEGEGCVLYIVAEAEPEVSIPEEVMSLCKLKTLEYRIYRKLREKLKNCIQYGVKKGENMEQFVKEATELCQFYPPAKPFDYYMKVAEAAFENVIKMNKKADKSLFYSKYIDFLEKIQQEVEANSKITLTGHDLLGEDLAFTKKRESISSKVIVLTPPLYVPLESSSIDQFVSSLALGIGGGDFNEEYGKKDKATINIVFQSSIKEVSSMIRSATEDTFLWVPGRSEEIRSRIINLREELLGENEDLTLSKQNQEFLDEDDPEAFLEKWEEDFNVLKSKITETGFRNFEFSEAFSLKGSQSFSTIVESEIIKKITSILSQRKTGVSSSSDPKKKETLSQSSGKLILKKKNTKNNLVILVPLGIPGMGKSTMLKQIKLLSEERQCSFRVLSSDETRRKMMDELQRKNKNNKVSHEDLFEKTNKQSKKQFFKDLKSMIEQVPSFQEAEHIIFLDKNHPPEALKSTMKEIHRISVPNVEIKVVAVIPLCYKNLKIKNGEYPFSENFVLNCMSRAIKREDHQTLVGEPLKILNIVTLFVKLYKNFKFKGANLTKMDIDYYIELPFTIESKEAEENETPSSLSEALENLIVKHKFNDKNRSEAEQSISCFPELSALYECLIQTKPEFFKFVDPVFFGKYYSEGLENILKLFSEKRGSSVHSTPNSGMRPAKPENIEDEEEEKFEL